MDKFIAWEKDTGHRQSYSAFARYLGVKQSSLSQWMAGNYPPTGSNLQKIAEKLGYDIYIVVGEEMPTPLIKAFHEAQETYNALPPEQRQAFLDKMNAIIEETLTEYGAKRVK